MVAKTLSRLLAAVVILGKLDLCTKSLVEVRLSLVGLMGYFDTLLILGISPDRLLSPLRYMLIVEDSLGSLGNQ